MNCPSHRHRAPASIAVTQPVHAALVRPAGLHHRKRRLFQGAAAAPPSAVRRDRRPAVSRRQKQDQQLFGEIPDRTPRPLPRCPIRPPPPPPALVAPPFPTALSPSSRRRPLTVVALVSMARPAAELDAGLHQAELDHVGRDIHDAHALLLVDDRRGERIKAAGVRRQAPAVRAQEEALRRRALGGQHHGQPMPLLQEKEEPREDDGESSSRPSRSSEAPPMSGQ
ncbi:hypothetical protein ZWY2020_022660 [Hordeum vulgare]|nr:hypothetical protein ZWY2020_022660 [Hordeum vulgare]